MVRTALTRRLGLKERAEGPEQWVQEERSGRGCSMCEVVGVGECLASAGEKEGRKESQRETGTGGQRDFSPRPPPQWVLVDDGEAFALNRTWVVLGRHDRLATT